MKPAPTRALYAGSFDPITRGHLDIIQNALTVFDFLHVAVGLNPLKTGLFEADERVQLIKHAMNEECLASGVAEVGDIPQPAPAARVDVGTFAEESIVRYARRIGATHIVRGLRQASDFDDEFRYHGLVGRLDPDLPMVHFFCREAFVHVSSSTARELASLNEDVSWLVTKDVERVLRQKFLRT